MYVVVVYLGIEVVCVVWFGVVGDVVLVGFGFGFGGCVGGGCCCGW